MPSAKLTTKYPVATSQKPKNNWETITGNENDSQKQNVSSKELYVYENVQCLPVLRVPVFSVVK